MAPTRRVSKKGKHSKKDVAPEEAAATNLSGSEADDAMETAASRPKNRAGVFTGDSVDVIKARMAADQLTLERMEAAAEIEEKIAVLQVQRESILAGSFVPSGLKDSPLGESSPAKSRRHEGKGKKRPTVDSDDDTASDDSDEDEVADGAETP